VVSEADSDVDSARCDTKDDELPPGVYRDADGTVLDADRMAPLAARIVGPTAF